jgi:VCBS repeat-containing protein
VANSSAINYLINPVFNLTISVHDNGSPVLSSSAAVTITVTPTNTAPVILNQAFSVNENSPAGTSVGQVAASDPDTGQSLVYAIVSGNTGNTFQMSASGLITVNNASMLDFENPVSFQLLVQVTDNGVPALASSTNITISVNDVNENPVVGEDQTFVVAEHVAAGTQVGTVLADDPDNGQILNYSIVGGNTGNVFAISPASGLLTVAGNICFEACGHYTLTVRTTDNATPPLTGEELVVVNLTDVNEVPSTSAQAFAVASYSLNGTFVGTVAAADPDLNQTLSFSITAGNTDNAFAIDAVNGSISVANSSAINYLINPVFNLTISVQDNGSPVLSSSAAVTITVTPTNTAPVILNQAFSVNENSPAGTSVAQVAASDPDPGQSLVYAIVSGNTGNTFQMSTSGLITVNNASMLDFENPVSFQLLVQVTDNGVPALASSTNITISVNDVNENPVVGEDQTFVVAEHVAAGTQVGTVLADDPDNGQILNYSIVGGNTGNAFTISPASGLLTVAGNICFEACGHYTLTVRTTDNATPPLTGEEMVVVNLTDVNEAPSTSAQVFAVASYSLNGTFVGTVAAADPDLNQTLSFSITAGNTDNAFAIDAVNGSISVANSSAINYLINPVFNLTISVQDNGSPVLSSSAAVTITVTPTNTAPVILNQAFSINENSPAGTSVAQVAASDPDPGQSLVYAIVSGNTGNTFQMSASGLITVNNASMLDFENPVSFQLLVQVTDNGVPALASSTNITISVNDVNEAPLMNDQAFSINENATAGSVVGNMIATDPDQGQSLTYSIFSGNTGSAFAIHPVLGEITVNNSAALNFEATPIIRLTIQVMDNGSPITTKNAYAVISLNDINETPQMNTHIFHIQ